MDEKILSDIWSATWDIIHGNEPTCSVSTDLCAEMSAVAQAHRGKLGETEISNIWSDAWGFVHEITSVPNTEDGWNWIFDRAECCLHKYSAPAKEMLSDFLVVITKDHEKRLTA